jgi:hypothetical protein
MTRRFLRSSCAWVRAASRSGSESSTSSTVVREGMSRLRLTGRCRLSTSRRLEPRVFRARDSEARSARLAQRMRVRGAETTRRKERQRTDAFGHTARFCDGASRHAFPILVFARHLRADAACS